MLSVIIPVYNTGEYLRDCVRSVCSQTFKDLQIILIDDGSEDKTAELCDILAAEDPRITVIHKKNEGVSIARNLGLEMADGEYVSFIDSDDTVDPHMFEQMISAITESKSQIAMCDAITICPGKVDEIDTIPDYPVSAIIESKSIPADTLTRLAGSACRCMYKRHDTLLEKRLRFPAGIKFSEDRIFNIIAMGEASKIAYIKRPFYRRLIRPGSACFRFYPDMTFQIITMRRSLLDAVHNYWGEKYIRAYEQQIAGQILYAITNFTSPSNGHSSRQQITKIKELCNSEDINECIIAAGNTDLRSRAILKKRHLTLFIIGKTTNIIHRICRKGQYRP